MRKNDELAAHYEKLKAQEAVQAEAEQFMTAREEDAKVLDLMIKELLRDKDILLRKLGTEMPDLVAERDQLAEQVNKIRLENDQLLQGIRTTATVKTEDGMLNTLDLSSLYSKGNSCQLKQPPKQLS